MASTDRDQAQPETSTLRHWLKTFVDLACVVLVVMATHGRSGLERLVMGSVAEAVLRRLHVPVMMVRPQPTVVGETRPAEAPAAG